MGDMQGLEGGAKVSKKKTLKKGEREGPKRPRRGMPLALSRGEKPQGGKKVKGSQATASPIDL